MDFVEPKRSVPLSLVSGRGHYERVIDAVLRAEVSVWIATSNLKELLVEDPRRVSVRRGARRPSAYRSVLESLDDLAKRGVELRILHAKLPSLAFRKAFDRHPHLVRGGLELRLCPRVHLKTVIVDGRLLYLGSANWTGAGLGAKGTGRRNFELGILTDDEQMLDQVQALYEHLWRGRECGTCKLRDVCDAPLDLDRKKAPPAPPTTKKRAARAEPRTKRARAKRT
ncbi:phospholipase D family protein [Myxococcota bacterium]|nr:phospholipase D family protein [Myxococcota bacterium]